MMLHDDDRKLVEGVLDVYGGDRTRWPSHVRHKMAELAGQSSEVQALIVEAQALDCLLDAPEPQWPAERMTALAHRISAQAERLPRLAAVPTAHAPVPRKPAAPAVRWRALAGAASLAASLAAGVLLGQSPALEPALGGLANVVGLYDAQQVAHSAETDVAIDEDLL